VQGKGLSALGRVSACPVASGPVVGGALSVTLCLAVPGSRQSAACLLAYWYIPIPSSPRRATRLGRTSNVEPPTSRVPHARRASHLPLSRLPPPTTSHVPPRRGPPWLAYRAALLAASDKSLALAAPCFTGGGAVARPCRGGSGSGSSSMLNEQ
jgi:hypothetical protein